jgi:hypothetical protein
VKSDDRKTMDAMISAATVSPATSDHRPLGIDAVNGVICVHVILGVDVVNGAICVHVFRSLPTIVVSVGITRLRKHKTISIFLIIHSVCRMFVRYL